MLYITGNVIFHSISVWKLAFWLEKLCHISFGGGMEGDGCGRKEAWYENDSLKK
jgi:hypothetical protein